MTYHSLQHTTAVTLQQLINLLLQLDSGIYAQPLPILSGSSVGKHVRHITEFYLCLFKGMECSQVNYDARQRNVSLETDRSLAILTLQEIISHVIQVQTDQPLNLSAVYHPEKSLQVATTLYRELIYNLEHCIHHLATIRIGVSVAASTCAIPQDFGVAPSTIQYRQAICAQ